MLQLARLIFLIALIPFGSSSISAKEAVRVIDAKTWIPTDAALVKQKADIQEVSRLEQKGSVRELEMARDRQMQRATGYGSLPHAPMLKNEFILRQQLIQFNEIQRTVSQQSKATGDSVADLMMKRLPQISADETQMILTTPQLGPLTTGGWIWVYEPDTRNYLGGAGIAGDGSVNLPVLPGEVVDVVVFANPPFAFQAAREIAVQSGKELTLKDSSPVAVSIIDNGGSILDGFNSTVRLVLSSYYNFSWGQEGVAGTGTIYLAAGETYDIRAEPGLPYLVSDVQSATFGNQPLEFPVRQGAVLDLAFQDPDGLLDIDDCRGDGTVSVSSSQESLEYNAYQLSVPVHQYNANSDLVGASIAVPPGVAVDFQLRFYNGPGWCSLENIDQRFAWFSDSRTIPVTLKARSEPNIIFQTPTGDPLTWDWGYFYTDDSFDRWHYFSPGNMPSLKSGETYYANVRSSQNVSVNETRIVSRPGKFDVVLESEPLLDILGQITMENEDPVNALIEFYRDGVLVSAFEYRGRELTMQIPAGTYDVRISGITSQYWDEDEWLVHHVVLKPIHVQRTFSAQTGERMDFNFTLPTHGVHFEFPSTELPHQVFVYENDRPVSGLTLYPWQSALLSDFEEIDMIIRGPGLEDTRVQLDPTTPHEVVDLQTYAGNVGRIQGAVVDAGGHPVADSRIDFFAEDGVFGWGVQETDENGGFDIPKSKNGLYMFSAPTAGNSLTAFHEVSNPADTQTTQIKLTNLAFHEIEKRDSERQLFYGDGQSAFQIVFLAEGYVSQGESFTDSNQNGVWDGALFIDINLNGLWDGSEPYRTYGNRVLDWQAEQETDITIDNEPFNDLNGDGYPNIDDFAVFKQNAKDYVRSLMGTPVFRENIKFDAHVVYTNSTQSGIDVYDETDTKIIEYDTHFDGSLWLQRHILGIDGSAVHQYLDGLAPERDLTVVMMNMPVRAGRVTSFILAYGGVGNSSPNNLVAGHEFGHNPGGLGDEYEEFSGTSTNYLQPGLKHLTHRTKTSDIPWFPYLHGRKDLPITTPGTPGNGVYAGGAYQAGGAYRSTSNSRMRGNSPEFNDISIEVLEKNLCRRSLVEGDFIGRLPTVHDENTIHADGFESLWGTLVLCP